MAEDKNGNGGNGDNASGGSLDKLLRAVEAGFAEMNAKFIAVDVKFDQLRSEVKGDIANLRDDVKNDIANLRGELKSDIADLTDEVSDVRSEIAAAEHRLGARFDNRFDNLNRESGAQFLAHEMRITKLEQSLAKT